MKEKTGRLFCHVLKDRLLRDVDWFQSDESKQQATLQTAL